MTVTAGTYTYTVTDANGCTNSTTITITEPTALVASSSATAIACNGGTSTVTVSASGGTAPYTGTGPVTVTAGTYTYTVTDANGCTNSTTITVTEPTALVASSSATAIACNGGTSTVTVSASGGTAPYTGTGPVTVTAGTYTYTVTDANGCTNSTTITVTEPTALVASSSATAIACNGGTSTVTVSATGGTGIITGTGTFTVTAGTYTYTVTDANGCTNSTTITVTQPSPVVATYSATPILCYGQSTTVTISATGGTGPYTGTGPMTQYVGTIVYTVTDNNGCQGTVSVTLTEPAKVEGTATSTPTTCAGNDGTATVAPTGGTGSYTYSWSNGPTTQSISSLVPGTYTVIITDGNGCTGSASTSVTSGGSLPATPGAISGPGGACRNQTGVVYSIVAVPGATSYDWVLPAGASGSSTSNSITVSFGPTYAGGFICVASVNVCGTSTQSCMNIPVLTIIPSQPTPISGPSIICGGNIATYTATSTNALSYLWSVTGTGVYIISGQKTNSIQVNIPIGFGQGSVQVRGVNCMGNSQVRGMTITGTPIHSNAVIGPNYICANNTATYTMPLVTGASTYTWTTTGDITLITSSQNSLNTVASFNFGPAFTSGTITITASNSCGSFPRTFVVRSAPDQPGGISGPGTGLCGLSGIQYSISAVATATSYTWTSTNGIAIQSVSPDGLTVTVNFTGLFTNNGNICVVANNGCGSSVQRCFTVSARPSTPVVSGSASGCKSQTAILYSIPVVPTATSYTWSVTGGGVITPSGLTASVNYTSATSTSAIVRVNAINTCGASQPGVKNVSVNLLCRTASDENSSEFSGDLTAYPNPTSGKATVEFTTVNDSKMLMTIMDLPGNILISEVFSAIEGNNTVDIDLSDLAKGIYLLNLKSGENVSKTIRLVVE
ncbi:MAG: T9SS type A sorting domain-containing protein [Bacteroidetes bacterium]|nr:T9SS type A sorting domain-containing protein [Bacteroidota bacterium]